jgi:hypothetical protein
MDSLAIANEASTEYKCKYHDILRTVLAGRVASGNADVPLSPSLYSCLNAKNVHRAFF